MLTKPLVTLHTTGDDVVPFWHEVLYFEKTRRTSASDFTPLAVNRYGHCKFEVGEALAAFVLLGLQVASDPNTAAARQSALDQARHDFLRARDEALPSEARAWGEAPA